MKLWPSGGLWRHRDFLNLWTAETVSQLGSQISQIGLPLVAIIVLEASAFEVALLGVIEFAPFILISLPAGVWVDRLRRKPILVTADLGRALLLASIPVAYWLDALTIWQLYVVGFVVGVLTVFFDVSYQAYLPSLVSRQQLIDGNSKLEISRSGAQLAGPGLGGALVQVLTAPVAVLVDAISFLASAIFLVRIRKQEQAPTRAERQAGPGMKTELKEGLAWVLGNRYLRWIAASTATFNFFSNMLFAVFLVFAVRVLELRPGVIGLIFAVGSIGYLVGALLANRVSRRFGVGPTIIIGALGSTSLASARGRADVESDSVRDRRPGHLEHGHPDLQHHPGQLPSGDHAGAAPGADELGDALRRLGRDSARLARRRRACDLVRAPDCDLGRRDRHVARSAAGAPIAGADAARDAGAGRGAAPVRSGRRRRAAARRGRPGPGHCAGLSSARR